jgi:hypothetical protein
MRNLVANKVANKVQLSAKTARFPALRPREVLYLPASYELW